MIVKRTFNIEGKIFQKTKIDMTVQHQEYYFLKKSGSFLIVDNNAGDSALLSQFKVNIKVNVNVHEHYVLI